MKNLFIVCILVSAISCKSDNSPTSKEQSNTTLQPKTQRIIANFATAGESCDDEHLFYDKILNKFLLCENNQFITINELELLKGQDGKNCMVHKLDNTATITCNDNSVNIVDGVNGNNGLSAFEIAVNNGFSGTEIDWLDSLRGEDGIIIVKLIKKFDIPITIEV